MRRHWMERFPWAGWLWGLSYRVIMRVAHRYHWHYAPPSPRIDLDGETHLWCKWCGLRYTIRRIESPLKPPPLPLTLERG